MRIATVFLLLLAGCTLAATRSPPVCVEEGEKFSARDPVLRCCEGLSRIEANRESSDPTSDTGELPVGCEPAGPPDIKVCTQCGDGICGAGENRCNCVADCRS